MKVAKKSAKRALSVVMALIMAFGALIGMQVGLITANAADAREGKPYEKGDYWYYYSDENEEGNHYELRFVDDIPDIEDQDNLPWKQYAEKIDTLTIDDGSVQSIGAKAFVDLEKIDCIFIPKSVKSIDSNAFTDSLIKTVYYSGTYSDWNKIFSSDKSVNFEMIYNHDHKNSEEKRHNTESTCSKEGYEGDVYCLDCYAFVKKGDAIELKPHSWSENYEIMQEAECNKDGKEAKKCLVCGIFDMSDVKVIEKTCKHDWEVSKKVDDCEKYSDKKPGIIVLQCKNCKAKSSDNEFKKTKYIDKSGKELGDDWDKLTEEQKNSVVNKNQIDCNKKLSEELTKITGIHKLVYDRVEATCEKEGKVTTTCEYCEKFKEEQSIPKGDHNIEIKTIEATCVKPGEEQSYCTVCGIIVSSKSLSINPQNHVSEEWKETKPATCVSYSEETLYCNACGEEILNENGKAQTREGKEYGEHALSMWIISKEPTCDESGYKIKVCTNEGCLNYPIGLSKDEVAKISSRGNLSAMIKVVNDSDSTHYSDSYKEEKQNCDIPGQINSAFASKKASNNKAEFSSNVEKIFTDAVTNYGAWKTEEGEAKFVPNNLEGDNGFTLEQIAAKASEILWENSKADNSAKNIIEILEQAWSELGNDTVKGKIDDGVKPLEKEAIKKLEHNYYERAAYYIDDNNKTVTICKNDEGQWVEIERYDDEGMPSGSKTIPEDKEPVTEINCKTGGKIVNQCILCLNVDDSKSIQKDKPHDYETITIKATCTEGGYTANICKTCGHEDEKVGEVPKLGHKFETINIKEATCSNDGITAKKCSRCDYIDPDSYEISTSLPHNNKNVNSSESCTECGRKGTECTNCGFFEGKMLPAEGHKEKKVSAKEPTCTEDGYKAYSYCTVCNENIIEKAVIKALGHKEEKVPAKEPTCTEDGYKEYKVCTVCGVETQAKVVIPRLSHSFTTYPAKEATCAESGQSSYTKCDRCGNYGTAPEIISAKGHAWGGEYITKEATAFRNGTKEHVCIVCKESESWSYSLTFFGKIAWVFGQMLKPVAALLNVIGG